jgi:hypothetical protein
MDVVRRFNRLGFEQWSLLISMTASAILFRQAPNLRSEPSDFLDERLGGMVGAFIASLLIPYGLAWLSGRMFRRYPHRISVRSLGVGGTYVPLKHQHALHVSHLLLKIV